MAGDLISKKTRNEFREFLVGWTLRQISSEFDAADIRCDSAYQPPESGQRRSLVEQYYRSLDFSSPSDARKLLAAYESILNTALVQASDSFLGKDYEEQARKRVEQLAGWLKRDGFKFENGRITPSGPQAKRLFDDQSPRRTISEVTRRNIFDALRTGRVCWAGRLSEPEFMARLYDLESLPSADFRFLGATNDIVQHRITNPDDWPDDWVFTDSRFNLVGASDEAFLRFLCEMIHPVVRPDGKEVKHLADLFNQHLAADGWEVVARTQLSGRPVFAGRRRLLQGAPSLASVKSLVQTLNAEYLTQQMTRMEAAVESDPELAVGTAKEFVETICKTILRECGETVAGSPDLLQLVRQVREKLDLLPDDVPAKAKGAETIKRLLNNLGTVAQGLAELRGLYGSGHGKDAKSKGLQARHARLAVGAAGTLAVFFFETYQARKGP